MRIRNFWIVSALVGASICSSAQWLSHPAPRTPRAKDGKPILSAPAPRAPNGKPDLTGIWEVESSPLKEIEHMLLPGGENGLGEDVPSKYFLNFFSDFPFGKEPFQLAAAAEFRGRLQNRQKPLTLCAPPSLPEMDLVPAPFKIVPTPGLTMMLYEGNSNFFRQIYTDGRKLPVDPQPSWLGYSVGKWEGDWFVVDTIGFNDMGKLDAMGHPRSESMHFTERFHRRDFGHMELQLTVDDPKTYLNPVTIKVALRLLPDTDLIESFCTEGESDLQHIYGK
jgi:hypothetical protein